MKWLLFTWKNLMCNRRRSMMAMLITATGTAAMLGDDDWLIMPASQRPLRISPLQKLLGEASTGDVATMTWGEDYTGTQSGVAEIDGLPCLRLELLAQRRGVRYPRVVLHLAQEDHRPVQAKHYVASDQLAKLARFTLGQVDRRWRLDLDHRPVLAGRALAVRCRSAALRRQRRIDIRPVTRARSRLCRAQRRLWIGKLRHGVTDAVAQSQLAS